MGTLVSLPIIEAKLIVPGHIRTSAAIMPVRTAVEVPFADVRGLISFPAHDSSDGIAPWVQLYIVDIYPVSDRVLPGHEAGAIWTADWTTGDRMSHVDALFR